MKKRKIYVLQVIGKRPMGGIGNVLLNYQTYMNRQEIQMDYLIFSDEADGLFDRKVRGLGSRIDVLPALREYRVLYLLYRLNKFFKNNRFDIIHVHSPNIAALCFCLAKKYGIDCRILHSHSTVYAAKVWNSFRNRILCIPLKWLATDLMACSREAGEFLFKGYKKEYQILNNAIDYKKYRYNPLHREKIRKELMLENNILVIGNVGKLVKDKNQKFLIHIISSLLDKKVNARLLLVGSGELDEALKGEAERLKLQDKIIFYGYSQNVENLLQAMDVVVMPSLNEGLPLAALEAQAAGLPCVLSKNITKEVSVRNCFYLSLDVGPEEWADKIIEVADKYQASRKLTDKGFIEKGFDIEREAEKLEQYYKTLKNSRERNIK